MKSSKKVFQTTVLIAIVVFIVCFNIKAQNGKLKKKYPDNCELISAKLDLVGTKFKESAKADSYLVIIAGQANAEKTHYNNARLINAVKYLNYFHEIKNEQIVSGTGQASNDLSYLRFYVNGLLVVEINTAKNDKLCVDGGY